MRLKLLATVGRRWRRTAREAPPDNAGVLAGAQPARTPPWPSVACDVWPGPALEVEQWLREEIDAPLNGERYPVPRQCALLWELRRDLQTHFPCDSVDSLHAFLAWAVTEGLREGSVALDLMPPGHAERWTQRSDAVSDQPDVPVLNGMVHTRRAARARHFLPDWEGFPATRQSRLSHGFWFAFVAPREFGWPDTLVQPLRAWWSLPSGHVCDGYRPSRAMMVMWTLRPDLQRQFDLQDPRGLWRYLHWVATDGLRELGLPIDALDPAFGPFLLSDSPRVPGVSQIAEMMHDALLGPADPEALRAWSRAQLAQVLAEHPAGQLLQPKLTVAARLPGVLRTPLLLTGQWSLPTGRGEDLRGSAEALQAVGIHDFLVFDTARGSFHRPDGSKLPQPALMEADVCVVHLNADSSFADWCQLHRLGVRYRRSVGFWAWELDRLPNRWRHAFGFHDEIWSASQFADAAFRAENLRPVRNVPMVVRVPESARYLSRAELGLPPDDTVFVFVFDFRSFVSRKNPGALLDAFAQAFPSGDEPVRLVIKTLGGQELPGPLAWLRERARDTRIEIRDGVVDRWTLLSLIHASDAFVSLHRSEGFGRGPAEAMLLGVPVILTDYSGTQDFADAQSALPVGYRLVSPSPDEYPGVEGQTWAEPDVAEAAAQMRWVHEHPQEREQVGRRGRDRVHSRYRPAVVGEALRAALFPPVEVGAGQEEGEAIG